MNTVLSVILQSLGTISIFVGVIFSALGVLGILRLPDAYSRLHASGKTSTLGILFICVGTGLIIPTAFLKLLALAIFIIFSGPVGSHAIAAAIHRGLAVQNRDSMLESEEFMALGMHELLQTNETEEMVIVLREAVEN